MKRRQRTILKSFDRVMEDAKGNGSKRQQEQDQIQRLKKVHLEKDEFTQHEVIENALVSFVVEARQLEDHYQGHRKRMIQTAALALADELTKIGKPELICHISEELMKVLKQVGIKWNTIYLRRVLDERYKNPTNRLNALARHRHPGVPQDTGKTPEELEASLNRKSPAGQFTVRTELKYVGRNPVRTFITLAKRETQSSPRLYASRIPVIVKVNAATSEAIVEVDKEDYNEIISEKKHQLE